MKKNLTKFASNHILTLMNLSDTLNLSSSSENNSPLNMNDDNKKFIMQIFTDSIKDNQIIEKQNEVKFKHLNQIKIPEFSSYFSKKKK